MVGVIGKLLVDSAGLAENEDAFCVPPSNDLGKFVRFMHG
jgi:hypothetical protein